MANSTTTETQLVDTETTINPADLVALANKAYAENERQNAISARIVAEGKRLEQAETLKNNLKKYLNVDTNPQGPRVEVGGLTFASGRYGVKLIRPCSKCKGEVHDTVQSLNSLGSVLAQEPVCDAWEAHRAPTCKPGRVAEPTPLETLGQALIDFLEANGYNTGEE